MKYVLAIDQGTTNTKALLMDQQGRTRSSVSRPVPIHFPRPGWVEQDSEELWRTVAAAMDECLERAGSVVPICLAVTNQRESTLAWDRKTGRPVGPCVSWQCRRSSAICSGLRSQGLERTVVQRTGLTIDPMFSAGKAAWLLDSIPHGLQRAENGEICIGTVDSWILWNLTGGRVHACDETNASRTQLFDIRRKCWDPDLLAIFGIPRACLPEVHPSSAVFGESAGLGRLPAGVPVASLVGDSHAALFGHAIFGAGPVKATYGTGSSLMTVTSGAVTSEHGLSTTIAWAREDDTRYALEGNIPSTGGTIQWLGEFLRLRDPAGEVSEMALSTDHTGGVYLVPAFAGLGAPHWKADARAVLCGMTRGTTAREVSLAAIESIGYQVRDVFDAMERDRKTGATALLADGGASRNDFLMQFQADILGRPVIRRSSEDLSAAGAAWLAGLAAGVWNSLGELEKLPRSEQHFEPGMSEDRRGELYSGWRKAVRKSWES